MTTHRSPHGKHPRRHPPAADVPHSAPRASAETMTAVAASGDVANALAYVRAVRERTDGARYAEFLDAMQAFKRGTCVDAMRDRVGVNARARDRVRARTRDGTDLDRASAGSRPESWCDASGRASRDTTIYWTAFEHFSQRYRLARARGRRRRRGRAIDA